jgi:hypothetical protein
MFNTFREYKILEGEKRKGKKKAHEPAKQNHKLSLWISSSFSVYEKVKYIRNEMLSVGNDFFSPCDVFRRRRAKLVNSTA